MLSLELIDSAIALARRRGESVELIDEVPGLAVLEEQQTLTGTPAAQRVRLKPLLAQTNFWRGLSTDPLVRPSRTIRTSADLAFAQVEALLKPHREEEGVLLAVPAGYAREQLGLLLGVVNETGIQVAGVVDAALAACSMQPAPARVVHLELELHQALMTVLEYVGGERAGLKRSRYEIALRHGVLALQQTWLQFIADNFVRKTRFDPLHVATTEQQLLDMLPGWLAQLAGQDRIMLAMQFEDRQLEIELEREAFIAAAQPHYDELQRLVQGSRVAGMPIALRVSQRIAALPGLLERFQTLRDCEVQVLPKGAAAIGALQYEDVIRRPPDELALVYQLPVTSVNEDELAPSAIASTPAALRPTHVLLQGRAWQITEQPLVIGWSVNGAARAVTLPAAAPGVSRMHCTVVRLNGSVLVEDHSTYGSFVNDERVAGRTTLTVGDRLRLGTPGVTLELIQMVKDDGTPQD